MTSNSVYFVALQSPIAYQKELSKELLVLSSSYAKLTRFCFNLF
jgi:hypothetical protein